MDEILKRHYVIYSEAFKRRRYARTRIGAEVAAFIVGLQTWWPNPLKASRVTIIECPPNPSSPSGKDET